jgi:hypothetical protein
MGGQLSVPQVMLSVPDWVKRSGEYNKAKRVRNRFLKKFSQLYSRVHSRWFERPSPGVKERERIDRRFSGPGSNAFKNQCDLVQFSAI